MNRTPRSHYFDEQNAEGEDSIFEVSPLPDNITSGLPMINVRLLFFILVLISCDILVIVFIVPRENQIVECCTVCSRSVMLVVSQLHLEVRGVKVAGRMNDMSFVVLKEALIVSISSGKQLLFVDCHQASHGWTLNSVPERRGT
ncbi:hypothetical protein KIL84_019094 [Mauremys mutica]|uniref:Uncharacterized protein n=1 Tax=Mauremys mutica TaxID=74926 RepID=A0A9D4BAB4_9SAUR|nr:hypothetical protein KIL84_019094 [Mauremys mutica]